MTAHGRVQPPDLIEVNWSRLKYSGNSWRRRHLLYLAIAVLIHFVLSIFATVWLRQSDLYERSVLRNQLIMVWLLPVVGAVLALAVGKSHSAEISRDTQVGNDPNVSEKEAITFGIASDD